MASFKDITAQKFGRLTALRRLGSERGCSRWLCRCDCGKETSVYLTHITRGLTKSCGCIWRETMKKHGMARTSLYSRWQAMKRRCASPTFKQFSDYGGRGISFAPEWRTFEPFANWATENGYEEGLELDRINPDGHYEPSNCRWITHSANMQNMRRTTWLCIAGEKMSLSDAAVRFGLAKSTIRRRVLLGEPHNEAVRPVCRVGART